MNPLNLNPHANGWRISQQPCFLVFFNLISFKKPDLREETNFP
jgi:hypothetical protein